MADGAAPQVNPAGGATTSWGPEEIYTDPKDKADASTRLMQGLNQGGVPIVGPDGSPGFVHHTRVRQFLADNPTYKQATVFTSPDGKPGFVPTMQAGDFLKQNPTYKPGLAQSAGWSPNDSRFASASNFYHSLVNDPNLQPPTTAGGWIKQSVLGPLAGAKAVLKIPQDAATDIGKYLRAEGEAPNAAPIVRNVTSPVGEAAAEFEGGQYEPKQLATMLALQGLPRSTAALRTLHRALGGYFTAKMASGAAQQASEAQRAYESGNIPEAVRQATGAGLSGGMAVGAGRDTVQDIAQNPQQALSDVRQSVVNPVMNAARAGRVLTDPTANMTPTDLAIRATKPRNTIPDVEGKISAALPHVRAAADQMGVDFNDENTGHDEVLAATRKAKQNVWNTLEQNHLAPAATFQRDTTPVADKIQSVADGMSDIAKRRNPGLVDQIQNAAADYRGQQMSVADMEQRIQELNNDLYAEQGRLKVAQDTLRRDPAYAHQFAELDGLRGALNEALDQVTGPGAADLKRTYGSLKAFEDMVERSRNVAERKSPVGLFGGLGKIAGMGNVVQGGLRTLGGDVSGVPQLAKGAAEYYMGKKAQAMNDRNNLLRQALQRTTPGTLPAAQPWVAPAPIPPATPPPQARAAAAGAGGQQLGIPSFANLGQPAQTPAPAENVAPAAPKTPQRAPEQQAAIDQAVAHANNGKIDRANYAPLRQQAYKPELEPESLHGTSQQKGREGESGLATKEANQVNGQYTPERQALHQRQVEQVLGPRGPEEKNPVVIFQGGGASSGKTEALGKKLQAKYPGIAVSDSDVVKFGDTKKGIQGLPEAEALKQSDPLGSAERMHEESSDITKQIAKEARSRKQSIIIDGVGGNPEKMAQQIKEFKDAGYRVEVHYADKDVSAALKGMARRYQNTQRWVPPDVLEEGHRKAAAGYHQVAPLADEATLSIAKPKADSDVGKTEYQLVHRSGRGYNEIVDPVLYQKHLEKGGLGGRNGLQRRGVDREGLGGVPQGGRGGGPGASAPESAGRVGTGGQAASGRALGDQTQGVLPANEPVTQQGNQGLLGETGAAGSQVAPLHLAENAPPKDKPVMLTYGGAFNPAHEGHVAAVQAAHDLLTKAGYNVEGTVVAPTAEKLLANKPLGEGETRLGLQARARIAEAAFPKEINGKPVTVSTGPAEDVERNPGKPRRSDLAKSVQQQYPNHTIVNVTGEDASVPGAPKTGGPELYQGEKGTAHEGVNYFTVPRIGEMSSSKIRAALKSGEPIPGMTPEAEQVYREELAKAQGGRLAGQDGKETSVLTPSGNQLHGRYRVVEGDTLTPSHDPMTFAKNPNYPEGVQERAYHSSKDAQTRVIQQEQNYDPRYTVNDDPTGQNGPAITTPDGTVLGGNSRVMTSQRLYAHGQGDVYKNALIEKASQFGLDPEQIRGMKKPTLVREIDAPRNTEELHSIGRDLNKSMTGSLGVSERAVSAGKSLKPESLHQIGTMMDKLGEDGTLRKLLGSSSGSKAVLDMLQRDGVITDRERPAFVDTESGGLSEEGKTFVERALRGRVIDNPDLLDNAPKSVLNKLDQSLPDLATLGARKDQYNLPALVRAALRDHIDAGARGQSIGEFYGDATPDKNFGSVQSSALFPPPKANPVIETLGRALGGPAKNLRQSIRKFTQDARIDVAAQGSMLQMMRERPSAVSAFNHAFGTHVTEAQYNEALRDALHSERGGSQEAEAPAQEIEQQSAVK